MRTVRLADIVGRVEPAARSGLKWRDVDAKNIELLIARAIPGAEVQVRDLTGAGDHFEALVISEAFEGKGLVERHQLVYKALGDTMRAQVHALTLKTLTPAQRQARR